MKSFIICLGNRLLTEDCSGPAVFDRLQGLQPQHGVTVIEGGTAGLNLLHLLESGGRVVFVDTVSGFTDDGKIVVLDQVTLMQEAVCPHYGHDTGLPYVLSVLPEVCEGEMPEEVFLIGLEGMCDDQTINRAAELSISIAVNGRKPLRSKDSMPNSNF